MLSTAEFKLQLDNVLSLSSGAWLTAFRIFLYTYVYEFFYQLLLSMHVSLWVMLI